MFIVAVPVENKYLLNLKMVTDTIFFFFFSILHVKDESLDTPDVSK